MSLSLCLKLFTAFPGVNSLSWHVLPGLGDQHLWLLICANGQVCWGLTFHSRNISRCRLSRHAQKQGHTTCAIKPTGKFDSELHAKEYRMNFLRVRRWRAPSGKVLHPFAFQDECKQPLQCRLAMLAQVVGLTCAGSIEDFLWLQLFLRHREKNTCISGSTRVQVVVIVTCAM